MMILLILIVFDETIAPIEEPQESIPDSVEIDDVNNSLNNVVEGDDYSNDDLNGKGGDCLHELLKNRDTPLQSKDL